MKSLRKIQIITIYTLIALFAGFFQSFVIYPIEKHLFMSEVVEYVSWVYIPRSFHVFVVMMLGMLGLIPVFIGTLALTSICASVLMNNAFSVVSSVSSLAITLLLVNYMRGEKWSASIISTENSDRFFKFLWSYTWYHLL